MADEQLKIRLVGDGAQLKAVVSGAAADFSRLERAGSSAGQSIARNLSGASAQMGSLSKEIQRSRSEIGGLVALGSLQKLTGEIEAFGIAAEAVFAGRVVKSLAEYVSGQLQAVQAMAQQRAAAAEAAAAAVAHHRALNANYAAAVAAGQANTAYAASLRAQIAASNAAAIAATRHAASLGTLSTLMRVLGGPLGLISIAATGLAFWAGSARAASKEAEELGRKAKEGADQAGRMTRQSLAEQILALEQMNALYASAINQANAAQAAQLQQFVDKNNAAIEKLKAQLAELGAREKRLAELMNPGGASASQEDEAAKRRERVMEEGRRLAEGVRTAYEKLSDETHRYAELLAAGAISQETFNRLIRQAGEEYAGTSDKMRRFSRLQKDLFPERTAAMQLLEDYQLLTEYLDGPELEAAIEALHRKFWNAWTETQDDAEQSSNEIAQIYEDAATSIYGSFRDMFRAVFDDGLKGFKDVGRRLVDVFKDALASMAALAIARPVIVPIVSTMGGMMGVPADAQAAVLGQLGGLGSLGSIAGGLGLLGSLGANFSAGLTAFNSYVAANGVLGGMGSSLAFSGQMLGAGNIGAAIGSALPAIGAVAAVAYGIDKLTGGSLFGTSWRTTASGYDLSVAGADVSGRQFESQKKKKALFGGSKRRTIYSDMDPEVLAALDEAIGGSASLILEGAAGLGIATAEAIVEGFRFSERLDLAGKSGEEAKKAVEQWIDKVVRMMGQAVLKDTRFSGLLIDASREVVNSVFALGSYIGADPLRDAREIERLNSRTLTQAADDQRKALEALVKAFDGSEEATLELAKATAERYQTELQLLAQIQSVRSGISSLIGGSIESIRQSVMSPDELYSYLTGRAETLRGQLSSATDPEIIAQLVQQIDQLTTQAYGLVPESMRGETAGQFIQFLEGVQTVANQRLELAEQSVVQTHERLAQTIENSMKRASDALIAAAEEQKRLAEEAAKRQQEALTQVAKLLGRRGAY